MGRFWRRTGAKRQRLTVCSTYLLEPQAFPGHLNGADGLHFAACVDGRSENDGASDHRLLGFLRI